jgi:hypothetical protein
MSPAEPMLTINSLADLFELEPQILKRIERFPNGGNLFLIHPFLLLRDVGVSVSPKAEQEILAHEPHLTGLSPVPYQALKASTAQQNIRVHLHGLFERQATK